MGSDFEKKSASRRLSQEMWSSTREEGAPDGTGGGGFPDPAIVFVGVQVVWEGLQRMSRKVRSM